MRRDLSSLVNLTAVTDAKNKNREFAAFKRADEAVIAYAILPEFPELRTVKSLAEATRIVERGKPFREEADDATCGFPVEFLQFLLCCFRKLNRPGQDC